MGSREQTRGRKQGKGNSHGRPVTHNKGRHFEASVMLLSSLSVEYALLSQGFSP